MTEKSSDQAEASVNGTSHVNGSTTADSSSTMTQAPPLVKRKVDDLGLTDSKLDARDDKRRKGTAPIKQEYLLKSDDVVEPRPPRDEADDDAAEAFHHKDRQPATQSHNSRPKRREKKQGQNKARDFGSSRDEVGLCSTRIHRPELSPDPCSYGDKCRFEHDLRKYLQEYKRQDLNTFNGLCPVWQTKGRCPAGWKCRFVGSHSKEVEHEGGRRELILLNDETRMAQYAATSTEEEEAGVANILSTQQRIDLTKKRIQTPKSDDFLKWLDSQAQKPSGQGRRQQGQGGRANEALRNSSSPEPEPAQDENKGNDQMDSRASFIDTPLRPSEKRRLYFGIETPVLAPLTTQGNLPFRRLCTSLGATFTYSEMAMSLPLLQGQKSEWALIKAHESEVQPPTFSLKNGQNIVYDYDQNKDLCFGAQIAANKPWLAIKATEVLTTLLPKGLRVVDLNVGCPIDLVYREGAGSALMDTPP